MKSRKDISIVFEALERRGSGESISDICSDLDLDPADFFSWQNIFTNLEKSETRSNILKNEITELKALLLEKSLEVRVLREMLKNTF